MIAVLAVVVSLVAATWIGMHTPSRRRYGVLDQLSAHLAKPESPEDRRDRWAASDAAPSALLPSDLDRWRPEDIAAVVECALCGPTPAALEPSGLCWRCAPIARQVHRDYGHTEKAS